MVRVFPPRGVRAPSSNRPALRAGIETPLRAFGALRRVPIGRYCFVKGGGSPPFTLSPGHVGSERSSLPSVFSRLANRRPHKVARRQGNADPLHTRRRAGKGTPTSGRHARSGGPRNGVTPPAKTAGTAWERRPLVGTRGSAKPAPMTVRRTDVSGAPAAQSGLCCSLRFAQRCRPEVGVPLLACRLCSIGPAPLAPLRGAVPTRGRRSLVCASLVLRQLYAARPAARGDTA